jgi:para-aminobenzoate synthetase component I
MSRLLPSLVPRSARLSEQRLLGIGVKAGDFLPYARSCGAVPHGVVLLSGGRTGLEAENRYSIAAWDPMLVFQSKARSCRLSSSRGTLTIDGAPLEILDELFLVFKADFPAAIHPFSGGAVGYFAYDLKNTIERLPQTAMDDLNLPDIFLMWPRQVLVHDRLMKHLHFLAFNCYDDAGDQMGESRTSAGPSFEAADSTGFSTTHVEIGEMRVGPLRSNFIHEDYLEAVGNVRRYIGEGDVYQVNLSQRYQFPFQGDPFQLWESLFHVNPAPFYAYIHAGDHQVLSTSMERFLLQKDRYIETRPIKGTRKRGADEEEDEALRRELQRDPKDDAELSMIVDLLRNDIGRVCAPRTIRVAEHKRLETYENVHHLVSIVTGELRQQTTYGELLRATFPGGSITGCPKIRSMEIIDELEPNVRHIYTGAIGYLGFHRNLDLNVAIRTALIHNGACYFSVGGGIVYDSREEDEYQETLHKGRTLFQLIEKIGACGA